MSAKQLAWVALALGAAIWWLATRPRGAETGAPIDWSREPIQTATAAVPFRVMTGRGEVTLTPRAAYDVSAVVASTARYRLDAGAFVAPCDLVLTWGELPKPPWRQRLSYDQSLRYYFWRTGVDLDTDYVIGHSANTHLIPATANLRRAAVAVGRGDVVRLRGLLVDLDRDDGFRWHTSLSRGDTGNGGCELLWVTSLQNGDRLYR